jgi:hypothetical protein
MRGLVIQLLQRVDSLMQQAAERRRSAARPQCAGRGTRSKKTRPCQRVTRKRCPERGTAAVCKAIVGKITRD